MTANTSPDDQPPSQTIPAAHPRPDGTPAPTKPSLPRVPLLVTGVLLLVVGIVVGLTVTSIGAQSTGELGLDVTIAGHRDAVLTWLARFVNVGFGPLVAPVLLLAGCAIAWRRSHFAAVGVAALTIIGWLSVEVGKVLVHRMRPPAATVHALVVETRPDSYPSGHTAFAAALVFAVAATMLLAHHPTRTVWLVGIPFIVMVAASRLYLGAHYLSDVIASAVFAAGTVLIAVAIAGPWLLRLRNREESTTAG
ncbi:MAG: phosphatase PAP2 family protein [Actinomycetota bacterium]